MAKSRVSIVEQSQDGIYVWELDNGQWISDEDKNFLSMPSKKDDEYKLGKFREYAHNVLRNEGIEPNGKPVFLSGHRRVTDEQYEEQRARQAMGLTPDPFDVGALEDEMAYHRKFSK